MNIYNELRGVFYQSYKAWKKKMPAPAREETIDIVMPVLEKDLETLSLSLEAVRRYFSHPVGEIFLVCPDNPVIRKFCETHGFIFVEESTVLGYTGLWKYVLLLTKGKIEAVGFFNS